MSKQESTVLINDARGYQIELFEKAKKQNTIAVLDTGDLFKNGPDLLRSYLSFCRIRENLDSCAVVEAHHRRRARRSTDGQKTPYLFFSCQLLLR